MSSLSTAEVDGGMPERMGLFSGGKIGGHFLLLPSGMEMDTHLQEGFHALLRDFLLESQNFRR